MLLPIIRLEKNVTYVLPKKFLFLQLTIFSIVERKFFKSVGTRTSIFYAMFNPAIVPVLKKWIFFKKPLRSTILHPQEIHITFIKNVPTLLTIG